MRVFVTSFLVALSLAYTATAQEAKVIAEIAASSDKVVKNAPFSADAVSESVQTLADGNRIVRSSTSKLYRNSEGRFRREIKASTGGLFGSTYSLGSGVTILDPVGGHRYLLDADQRIARAAVLRAAAPLRGELGPLRQKGDVASLETTRPPAPPPGVPPPPARLPSIEAVGPEAVILGTTAPGAPGHVALFTSDARSKYDSRTENLGTRNMEGVEAEGTRTTTTIPADAIGNERPIEIVYERWHSKELDMTVLSKHNDPRFGEQTYRLTNIVRAEPDPSLFALPSGYKVITGDKAPAIYRLSTKRFEAEKAAADAKAAAKAPQAEKP